MQGLSSSTRRTYATAQRKFRDFCQQLGKLHLSGSPCPADEWTLCLFATFLAPSVHPSTIKVYLSGVQALHVEQGFVDPLQNTLRLHRVVWGIKRLHGSSNSSRLPITDNIMTVIWQSLNMAGADHHMFWAACTLGYFVFLCLAEFTVPSMASFSASLHLTVQDIAVDGIFAPSCMRVRIKASKTDPFLKGVEIHIGWSVYPLCAVEAMMAYLMQRGNAPGPLFLLQDGCPLSRVCLTDWLRQILSAAGFQGNFSSHSFRIGAATVAARNGVPDHLIQALGRWSSNAYQFYIRTPSEALASLSHKLA